jgi:hypothetical protein
MSSNAAAIRRRATPPQTITPTPNNTNRSGAPPSPTASASGSSQMTLPQVISTIDKRLIQLENVAGNAVTEETANLPLVVEEFNGRFEMIVTEINSLKDIVMKLQTYTMEVNKMLVDERIRVLSDLGNQSIIDDDTSSQEVLQTGADMKQMVETELASGV